MIIVASSFPERHNVNTSVARDLAAGFEEIVGKEKVAFIASDTVVSAVRRLAPSLLVLVGSPAAVESDFRETARACRAAGTCFAFWTLEDPYEFDFNFRFSRLADVVLTNDAAAVDFYEREMVYHMPLASKASYARPLDGYAERPLDIFFCGVGFPNRQALIGDLMPILSRTSSLVIGTNWPEYPGGIVVDRRIGHDELLRYYQSSRFVLNVGRSLSIANARNLQPVTPGPRTFDAAMVGCLQLYHRPSSHLASYFVPGKELLTFDKITEFEEIVRSLAAEPGRARAIAEAAQRRALRDHTFKNRAEQILSAVGMSIPGPAA